jgi:3-hydroxybutyryl-CoA dehydrogenase
MDEFKKRLNSDEHEMTWNEGHELPRPEKLQVYDVIIDLNLDEAQENLESYAGLKDKAVLGCAVKKSLAQMQAEAPVELLCRLGGINSLEGFIDRPLIETSTQKEEDKEHLQQALNHLGLKPEWVGDRVGMVTPRIVFMIINEACYTLQEGTATKEDIDQSMRLGTNYPYGPFEWSRKIGISNIYETLEALYQDTHEERYKICPLLKRKYLTGEEL